MAKEVILPAKEAEFDPIKILVLVMENASAGSQGLTFPEMRKRLRVLDVIKEAGEDATSIVFEDEDFNFMKDTVDKFTGFLGGKASIMEKLVSLHDAINSAKKPKKAEEKKEPE